MIYNQLLYFARLFDIDKAKDAAKGADKGRCHLLYKYKVTTN
jgi:DNA Polymerase alpha zinc finger